MYKLLKPIQTPEGPREQNFVCRIADNCFIPFDESNRDYREYLKWVAEGNQPLPADE